MTPDAIAQEAVRRALSDTEGDARVGLLTPEQIVWRYAPGRRVRESFRPTLSVPDPYTGELHTYSLATVAECVRVATAGEVDDWPEL